MFLLTSKLNPYRPRSKPHQPGTCNGQEVLSSISNDSSNFISKKPARVSPLSDPSSLFFLFNNYFIMFWRMAGLSTASPVDTILDRENFTLDELLDEDEIIQECKALNSRLINFLSGRPQVEQLIRYVVEEAPEDAEKKRTFKFSFLACEIFTCEVDTILKTLIEDEELMNLLFSFLDPTHHHSNLLAGYFSKVIVCLLLRKTVPFMQYVQAHQEIVRKLVDLIGITSIMEVLIRLIGADEHMYVNHVDAMQWIEETDVLEMIVDKFSSSDSPEVHSNAAETLCAITRFAPAGLSAKISSPSFIGRLFRNALEDSRPKSVLVNSLCVCISLLDPKRHTFGAYHTYNHQMTNGSTVAANPETVEGMLESLETALDAIVWQLPHASCNSLGGVRNLGYCRGKGKRGNSNMAARAVIRIQLGQESDLLKLLVVSSAENLLLTTFGKLQPPLGKHRLKIIEFISVLVTVGSEAAEKKLIDLGAVQRIIDLFFEYPYNNFLHHHVENIIMSCLESKNSFLVVHLLRDCDFVGKIIQAEKHFTLEADANKPTKPSEGKSPPRIGSIGHLTRISNKLGQLGNNSSVIQEHLQGNTEWTDWYADVLSKRNTVENVYQWACGYVLFINLHSIVPTRLTQLVELRDINFGIWVQNPAAAQFPLPGKNFAYKKLALSFYPWLIGICTVSIRPGNISNGVAEGCKNFQANKRPTALHDRNRDSDDDDYQDRDYDVAALANNLSQAFRYGIYNNENIEESLVLNSRPVYIVFQVHGSLERDDEDVYFDDESAEVVISSLRLGDDHESGSLFTNSNWFAFEEDREQVANERSTGSLTSPSPNAEEESVIASGDDDVVTGEDEDLVDTATSSPKAEPKLEQTGTDKLVEWVEWRESSDASDPSDALPNGESGKNDPNAAKPSGSPSVALTKDEQIAAEPSVSLNESLTTETPEPTHTGSQNPSSSLSTSLDSAVDEVGDSDKGTTEIKKEIKNE
ncbi:hypothetical protein Lal_00013241 [Lupinus albus]|nr:hypothetical protein Lal_00013241 [Lupinus albus]